MCRSRGNAPSLHLVARLIAAAILCAPATPVAAQGSPPAVYLLDVRINGWPLQLVARFRDEAGRLSLPAEQFDGLGLQLEDSYVTVTPEGERYVYLDQVPGLSWRLDMAAQVINIAAPFERLKPTRLAIAPRTPRIESRADWGALFSYDLYGAWSDAPDDPYFPRVASANLEGRLFSPGFTLVTTAATNLAEGESVDFVRLESALTIDNPDAPWRLQIGDSFSAGPRWVRPFRFGGVQWSRNFGLRPDMITTPMPSLGSNVAVPSTVDLFVNGVQRYSQPVTPGAVRLTDLPISGGTNALRVVVTDASGRRQELVLPLYSSTEMLGKGLSTYNVEAGAARQDYAVVSNRYSGRFASASYGVGVTDTLTLNGYASASDGYWSAAAGGAFTVGQAVMFDLALMHSDGPEGPGWAYQLAAERVARVLSLSFRYVAADAHFRDLASRFGATPLREQGLASIGVNGERWGHFNLTYARQRENERDANDVVSASYGVDVFRRRLHLGVSGYADLSENGWGVLLSATFPLGRRADAYLQTGRRSGDSQEGFAQVRGEAFGQRLDWQVEAASGAARGGAAQLDWDGYTMDLHLRAARARGSGGYELGLVQTLIAMGGGVFLTGRVDDAFALVETPGSPGVRVTLENHDMGRTDRRGRLLIPDLASYAPNAIGIEPRDLDMDASIATPTILVAPRERAGVITRFPIRKSAAVLLTLRLPDGRAPPVGAGVAGGAEPAMVGYGGEVYLIGLKPGANRLDVSWDKGACVVVFDAPAQLGGLPRLGPYTCAP